MSLRFRISWPHTLSARLTLAYSSAFALFLLLAILAMLLSVESILDNRMDEELREDIEELRELYQNQGLPGLMREVRQEAKEADSETFFIRLFNQRGEIINSSDLSHWQRLRTPGNIVRELASRQQEPQLELLDFSDHEHEIRAVYGFIGDQFYLHVGEAMEEKQEILAVLMMLAGVIFLVIIPCAAILGWLITRRATRGIKEVSLAAADIKNGLLDRRASVTASGDEITELAETFNAMAERIRSLITEMREMTDNIAHDLRSPLARIRAISEVSLSESTLAGPEQIAACQKAAADTLEECDRLLEMINTTLDVAEAEAGIGNANMEKINLTELAMDACELYEALAEQKGIAFNVALHGQYSVMGNRQNLQRMLANLIDNALKYTAEAGEITVELFARASGVMIVVADNGIGIPEAEQERIFERFYRCDQSRNNNGCGLGLSFSRAVARAHGGDITLLSEPKKSSAFTVVLPAT